MASKNTGCKAVGFSGHQMLRGSIWNMNLDLGLVDFSGIFEVKVDKCQRDPHHSTHVGPYFNGSSRNLEPLQRSNAAKG